MICAIYARRSTEQRHVDPEAKSVALQEAHARAFAQSRGWTVAADHVYADDAVSGADTRKLHARQRLLEVIEGGPPFQVLLMRDRSRFSREDGETSFAELKRIARTGVAIWFHQDGTTFTFGTFGENISSFVQAEGAAEYRRQIAAWTHPAMARKAQAGHVTGGRLFGYDNVCAACGRVIPAGMMRCCREGHTERRIKDAEAAVVRDIFRRAAVGEGLRAIAKALNAAGALAPRAQQGRPCSWAPSSVREVLHRETYRGVVTWNKTKKRDADGQQRQHDRPAGEWLTIPAEGLRVVPEALWAAVHDRLHQKHAARAHGAPPLLSGRGIRPRHFLTGFGTCTACGGSMMAVSRASGAGRQFRYACAAYWNRGTTVCGNNMMTEMALTDQAIGEFLRTEVLQPGIIGDALELAVAQIIRRRGDRSRVARLHKQLAGLDKELTNLAETAARGGAVPAVLDLLGRKDAERRRVAADLKAQQSAMPVLSARDLRQQLPTFLGNWRDLLGSDLPDARGVLDEVLRDRIRFEPVVEREEYRLTLPIALDRIVIAAVPALVGFASNDGVPNGNWSFLAPRDFVVLVAAA